MIRGHVAIFTVAILVSPMARGQSADDDAMKLATSILTEGASKFDTKDAKAMAETYTEDAELHLTTRREGGGFEVKVYRGKEEIRKFYEDYFKDAGQIHSENKVEFARLVRRDLLVIYGTFKPDTDSEPLPFVQTRTKQGDKWLMLRLQLFVFGNE